MSELTKTKIIDIQTGKAAKSVDNLTKSFIPLKKQIKDLIAQMGQLEKGTEEYERTALKLAELQQRQTEVMEAAKYSNKDFGAVMSNMTKVSMGLVGGINAVTASMAMLSGDSEEVQKVLQKVQLVMAVIQGFSAMDTALKSLKGLKNVFLGVGEGADQAVDSIQTMESTLDTIKDKKVDVSVEADTSGVDTIKSDIDSLTGKTVDVSVEADTKGIDTIKSDIDTLTGKTVDVSVEADTTSIDELKTDIDSLTGKEVDVTVKADESSLESVKSDIDSLHGKEVDVTVKADESSLDAVRTDIDSLTGKEVDVTVKTDESSLEAVRTEIETLPDEKEITITVNDSETEAAVNEVVAELDTIKDKKVDVSVNNKTDKELKKITSSVTSIKDKTIKVDADTKEAQKGIGVVKEELDSLGNKTTTIEVDATGAVENIGVVNTELETIPETKTVTIEGEGIGQVVDEVVELTEAENVLTTTTETTTAATESMAAGTTVAGEAMTTMSSGAKTATVATGALAAGETVATKTSFTLAGAVKAVGAAIKSIPVIGWILAGVAALTALVKLIVKANKESEKGVKEAKLIEDHYNKAKEHYKSVGEKIEQIRLKFQHANTILKNTDKNSKLYKQTLAEIGKQMGLDLSKTKLSMEQINMLQEAYLKLKEKQLEVEFYQNELIEARNTKQRINNALTAAAAMPYKQREAFLKEALKDLDLDDKVIKGLDKVIHNAKQSGLAISEVMDATVTLFDKGIGENKLQQVGAVWKTATDNVNYYEKAIGDATTAAINITEEYEKKIKELGVKREGEYEKEMAAYKKILEVQKQYISNLEDMAIADAQYEGDWVRLADERIKKANRMYNDDLKEYKKLLDSKLISKDQYDTIVKAREEQLQNEIGGIRLEANKKNWDEISKVSTEAIEKEKAEQLLAIRQKYLQDIRNNDPNADNTKNLAEQQAELDSLKKINEELKNRLVIMRQNADGSKEYKEAEAAVLKQLTDNERAIADQQVQIDIEAYNKRKQEAENYYAAIGQMETDRINEVRAREAGNTNEAEVEKQKTAIVIEAIRERMSMLDQMYEQGLISQQEYNSRTLELEAELAEAERQINEQRFQAAVTTVGNMTQTFQMMAGAVGDILTGLMENMDENSEEYKKMAVANAIIQTLSGTLGAFMSGVNSGIPAPYNLILAAVMAATTAATGIMQITKIKNGTDPSSSGMTAAAANVGKGEYETTAYAQQTEMFGTLADTKVYVTEHDISTAQNNVQVRENNTTF